ncbi:hypothetical protein [Sphingosinicella sp.]|uniref:hypothetical protein n=1 Tax=Sphingosinicella sp. TaxID=1917971 RepID=UPI0035B2958D
MQIPLSDTDAMFVPLATFLVSLLSFGARAETYNGSGAYLRGADDCICLDLPMSGFLPNNSGNADKWPAAWNFERIIRNILSHGGELELLGREEPIYGRLVKINKLAYSCLFDT